MAELSWRQPTAFLRLELFVHVAFEVIVKKYYAQNT